MAKMDNRMKRYKPYEQGILQLKEFANKNYTPEERNRIKIFVYQNFMNLVDNNVDPIKAVEQAKQNLYPEHNFADLIFTSAETGLSIEKVVELLNEKTREAK